MRDETEKDREFDVRIQRTERRHYVLRVTAKSEAEAEVAAMDRAGNIDFHDGSCSDPEYEVEDIEEAE